VHPAGFSQIKQVANSCFSSSTRLPRTSPPISFSTTSAQCSPSLSSEQNPQQTILPLFIASIAASFS